MPLKMLHGKGLLAIGFVLYVENVGTVNAVSVWSEFQQQSSPKGHKNNHGPSSTNRPATKGFANAIDLSISSPSRECDAAPINGRKSNFFGNTKRRNLSGAAGQVVSGEDCCHQCVNCLEPKQKKRLCKSALVNVRGGGLEGQESVLGAAAASLAVATPYNISLNAWKIIFQIILTTINVVCWLGPLKNKKFSENKLGLSLANAFSGGVFLSLAFGHFIPECVHGFEGYNEALPFMITLGGYLLIFFVEKVAFDAHSYLDASTESSKENGENSHSLSNGRGAVILLGALAVHSILEMTALGLASSFKDSAILTLSIALHQVCGKKFMSTAHISFVPMFFLMLMRALCNHCFHNIMNL